MAGLKLAIQVVGNILAQHAGYGIFRDELYYLVCGQHLAFGYVDQPPMVALQARLTEMLFGHDHMASLRLISGIAGAVKVFLTGALVWAMGLSSPNQSSQDQSSANPSSPGQSGPGQSSASGSRRAAAALAMLGVTCAGVYLGIDSYLSMNSFEPVFWLTCTLALVRIAVLRGTSKFAIPGSERAVRNWWILLGISAGLGLENKANEVFFLVAVLIALLISPQRRILASRWLALSIAIIVALALPNLLWQIHYHFPTLEWLVKISHSSKDVKLGPLAFLHQQMYMLTPWTIALWLSGVVWLLISRRAKQFRFLGIFYLVFVPMMMALHAKDYYLAPAYPIYFAAGAMCWLPVDKRGLARHLLVSAYALLLIVGFAATFTFSVPVLPPQRFVAWARTMHYKAADSENHDATILPQFYADRFGWHEMVDKVARIYDSLPPQERAIAGIYTGNYGEASAINILGRKYGLPFAISGHQNYWLWGPHGYTGQVTIVINGATLDEMKPYYASCEIAARMDNPLSMPWEKGPIFLCRGRKATFAADWKDFKFYY